MGFQCLLGTDFAYSMCVANIRHCHQQDSRDYVEGA